MSENGENMAVHEKFITKDDTKVVKSFIKAAEKGNESEFRVYSGPVRNVAEKVLRICFADYSDDNFFEVIDRNLSAVKYKQYQNQFHFIRKNLNMGTHEHNISSDLTHEKMVEIAVTLRNAVSGLLIQELGKDIKLPEVVLPSDAVYLKSAKMHEKLGKKQEKEAKKAIKVDVGILKDSKCEAKIAKLESKGNESTNYKASVIEMFNISLDKIEKKINKNSQDDSSDNEKINFVKLKRELMTYLEKYHSDINVNQYDFNRVSVKKRRSNSIVNDLNVEINGKYRDFLYVDHGNEKLRGQDFDVVEIPVINDPVGFLVLVAKFKVDSNKERVISKVYDIITKRETSLKITIEIVESFKVAVAFTSNS